MRTNITNSAFSDSNPNVFKVAENQSQENSIEAAAEGVKGSRSLLFGIKSLHEVTGRHQRGFDGEGIEGT